MWTLRAKVTFRRPVSGEIEHTLRSSGLSIRWCDYSGTGISGVGVKATVEENKAALEDLVLNLLKALEKTYFEVSEILVLNGKDQVVLYSKTLEDFIAKLETL